MEKKEYKNIFEAVKTHTGKEVEFLGDAKDKSKKEHKETDKEKPRTERAQVRSFRSGSIEQFRGETHHANETCKSGVGLCRSIPGVFGAPGLFRRFLFFRASGLWQ